MITGVAMRNIKLQIEVYKIDRSGLFDREYYARQFDKVPEGDLIEYYLLHALEEDRDPSPKFDQSYYLKKYADVRKAGVNPLYHYICHGKAEGRLPRPRMRKRPKKDDLHKIMKTIQNSGLFDEKYYAAQFDKLPKCSLLSYYAANGAYEDKDPSPYFDNSYYLESNEDIRSAHLNPLYHYIIAGRAERRPSKLPGGRESDLYSEWVTMRRMQTGPAVKAHEMKDLADILRSGMFDGGWYLDQNPDVYKKISSTVGWKMRLSDNKIIQTAGRLMTTAALHYISEGMYEDRDPSPDFSTSFYINHNPDLMSDPYLVPFAHYVKYGKAEHRVCADTSLFKVPFKRTLTLNTIEGKTATVSVITVNGAVYKGKADEIIPADEGIKAAIAKATGDFIFICDGTADFPEDILPLLKTECIYAAVRDESLVNGTENTALLSYKDARFTDGLVRGRYYGLSDIVLRNPAKFALFEQFPEITDGQDLTLLTLSCIRGGIVGAYADGASEQKFSDDTEYFKRLGKILFHGFFNDTDKTGAAYRIFRDAAAAKTGYAEFARSFKTSDIIGDGMDIMIGIYAFTFGGGEIMPIRLANSLYRMGHNVTVHILQKSERDEKVRAMLLPEIPVVYASDKANTAMYMASLGVQVYHSHHQASQQRAAEALDLYPVLRQKVLNVATSHGMYENLPEPLLHYLLVNSPLMSNTDRWTYVADKNLVPFTDYNVYDEKTFRKVPNGMERPKTSPVDLSSFGIGKDSFTVCIVSRAKKEKGWLNAVNAVERAREITGRDIHLLLIGDGEVYDEYSQTLSNDHIHFLGFRENPCDYMVASDLVTLPSYYVSESAPLCLIEAMMCSKPCLATDIGDVRDMLTFEGEPAGDVSPMEDFTVDDDDLTARLVRLVTDKKAYDKAVRTAEKKSRVYEIDSVTREYLSIYADCFAKTGAPLIPDIIRSEECRLDMLVKGENGTDPLVTVIVPNYNHERFLKERLDCIFGQTYPNIDVLLMDDCSSDNSRELLTSYAEKYPDKARILFNEKNSGGVFRQWAKGIQSAKGDLCWIAESDDFCERDFLECVLPAFEDRDVKLSYCRYCFVDENGRRNEEGFDAYMSAVSDDKWHHSYVNDAEDEVASALGIINTIPNASGAVFRRDVSLPVFEDEDWYRMKICGDWEFYLNVIKGGKVAYTADTTSYFRFHSNNSSAKTYTNDTYYTEHAKIASIIRNLYHTERSVIERNNAKIRRFYHQHVSGSDEDFEKLYSVDGAMRFVHDRKTADRLAARQREKLLPGGDTILIDPIMGLYEHPDADSQQKMIYSGGNSGNMLFVKATRDQLDFTDAVWFNSNILKGREKGTVSAVIPATNLIIAGSDRVIDAIRPIYEGTDCCITMSGLGAQAYPPNDTPKKLVAALSESKKNFFRMAGDRCVSLGIRGEFTAECLDIMGIHNYRIIGCPTAYKYMDGKYRELPAPKADRTVFTVTGKTPMESALVRFGRDNGSELLMQMPTEMPEILEGVVPSDETFVRGLPDLGMTKDEYIEFVKAHGHIFFNMDDWNRFMNEGKFTFSYGSRFHGNMSAMLCGIPALWITHDSRTRELVDTLHLPHITFEKFRSMTNAEEMLEYCDYSDFYKAYPKLCSEYRSYLEENGLTVRDI